MPVPHTNIPYLHEKTFPEALDLAQSKQSEILIVDISGDSIRGIHETSLWGKWQREVTAVHEKKYPRHEVPQRVMEYFINTKFCASPPPGRLDYNLPGRSLAPGATGPIAPAPPVPKTTLLDPFAPPEGFRPPRFSWSLTALQDFENCPRAYAEKRFFKRVKDKPFDAQDYGNRLHKTAEDYGNYLKANKQGTANFDPATLAVVKPYCESIVASAAGGELFLEHELNFTKDFKPCRSTDWDICWYRGKSDVTLIKSDTGYVFDYKGGKIKNDNTQLELMLACEALLFPQVQKFVGRYIWLAHNKVSDPVVMERKDLVGVWKGILARVKRMEEACQAQVFQAKTSGLCKKYCAVLSCPHNGLR